jgi:uncharacterized protein YjbJ (UPF0337 family)
MWEPQHDRTETLTGVPIASTASPRKVVGMTNRDQIEGEVKEQAGKLTDDESTENEGRAQEAWGDAKDKAGDLEDEVRDRL